MPELDKYRFYEESVQSPEEDVALFTKLFEQATGRKPRRLREDFCGTFAFSCAFAKLHPENTVEALDLDPEPLAYGRKHHLAKLTPEQRRRVEVKRKNVISVSAVKADLVVANNFSFYIFQQRGLLIDYFTKVRRSLKKGGMLIVEMVGGPGFIEKNKEQRTLKKDGEPWFTYIWDQKSFNPIDNRGLYAIHFRMPDGRIHKDCFVYDWRLWTIGEVRECLREAGFSDTCVFWETSHRGEATGEFVRAEQGDNDWTWLCYVGGTC